MSVAPYTNRLTMDSSKPINPSASNNHPEIMWANRFNPFNLARNHPVDPQGSSNLANWSLTKPHCQHPAPYWPVYPTTAAATASSSSSYTLLPSPLDWFASNGTWPTREALTRSTHSPLTASPQTPMRMDPTATRFEWFANGLSSSNHMGHSLRDTERLETRRTAFEVEEPKPNYSYIGLIAKAILSTEDRRMILSEIYQWIQMNYPYFRTRGPGWRNSIRHNLSLNDCFIKVGRAANGKGHYWGIHPANMRDFLAGDFRRRRAQRKVRQALGLACPNDDRDTPSPLTPPTVIPINPCTTDLYASNPEPQHPISLESPVNRLHSSEESYPKPLEIPTDLRIRLPTSWSTPRRWNETQMVDARTFAWLSYFYRSQTLPSPNPSTSPKASRPDFTVASLLNGEQSDEQLPRDYTTHKCKPVGEYENTWIDNPLVRPCKQTARQSTLPYEYYSYSSSPSQSDNISSDSVALDFTMNKPPQSD